MSLAEAAFVIQELPMARAGWYRVQWTFQQQQKEEQEWRLWAPVLYLKEELFVG